MHLIVWRGNFLDLLVSKAEKVSKKRQNTRSIYSHSVTMFSLNVRHKLQTSFWEVCVDVFCMHWVKSLHSAIIGRSLCTVHAQCWPIGIQQLALHCVRFTRTAGALAASSSPMRWLRRMAHYSGFTIKIMTSLSQWSNNQIHIQTWCDVHVTIKKKKWR